MTMLTRRDTLASSLALPLGLATGMGAAPSAQGQAAGASPRPPDLSFLKTDPLVNADRLRWEMESAGVDAILAMQPANVFYLSNHWPQLDRMGMRGAGVVVFPRDPAIPMALIMHAFLYYYTHTPESAFTDRAVYTYTQPDAVQPNSSGDEPAAQPARTMRVMNDALLRDLDRHRSRMFALTQGPSPDAGWALTRALRDMGLTDKRLGIDHADLRAVLGRRGVSARLTDGENIVRRARLAKSSTELRLMRLAAQANVDAAMAAAAGLRSHGSVNGLRAAFFAEAAQRGNTGHFMVVGGVSSEVHDEPVRDGTSVSIDCVSRCRFYHGDFGRTIFVGEPPVAIARASALVATAWHEIRIALRPGMRFADVSRIGRETLVKLDPTLSVSFTPHSVGLHHTDHPGPSLVDAMPPAALTLEKDMVLSVDCPIFIAGMGGTSHYEDLMLIGDDGAEPLHTVPPPTIIV